MVPTSRDVAGGIRVALRSNWTIGLLIFVAAVCLRLEFIATHSHFNNLFAVRGVPFSDGQQWTSAGIRLAEGNGLGSVYRPGFSVLLAVFYTWFGYSFATITALNIVIGSMTATFVFLIARAAFNLPIALAGSLFIIVDPSQIVQTPQASTEPLGLMLFVAAVYYLFQRGGNNNLSSGMYAGISLGLSNLARPLTLFCAPFYAAHLSLSAWLEVKNLRRALLPSVSLAAGILIAMSPWLIRQKLTHGVWAISTNLGEALYAATSPSYKTWTANVRKDADRDGVEPAVGARYRYFVRRSLDNIVHYPDFYFQEIAHAYWRFLNSFDLELRRNPRIFHYQQWTRLVAGQIVFGWITGALLLTAGLRIVKRSGPFVGGAFLVVSCLLLLAGRFLPNSGSAILLLGIVSSLFITRRYEKIGFLALSLAATGIGNALFNNAILYRAVLMTDWIFALFYLAAFYYCAHHVTDILLRYLGQRRLSLPMFFPTPPSSLLPFERWIKTGVRIAGIALAFFFGAGFIRLGLLNFRHQPAIQLPALSQSTRQGFFAHLLEKSPETRQSFDNVERTTSHRTELGNSVPVALPSPSVSQPQFLSPFIFYFPAGTEFKQRDPIFSKRPIDCSIFYSVQGMTVFPGEIPNSFSTRPVMLVGWFAEAAPEDKRRKQIFYCNAILPLSNSDAQPDYAHALTTFPGSPSIRSFFRSALTNQHAQTP
jgi:hypothetical protein